MNWRHRAACRAEDPELFFPVGMGEPTLAQIVEAKSICHRCPVVGQCLAFALETGQDAGVWGGMTEHERRDRRRSNRARTYLLSISADADASPGVGHPMPEQRR